MGQLHVPTHPFPQLGLHGLLLSEKLNIAQVHNTKDRQQQLVCYILQGHSDLIAEKKEGMGVIAPSADQVTESEQVSVVRQAIG